MKLAAWFALILTCRLAGADAVETARPVAKRIVVAERACQRGDAKACTRAGDLYTDAFFSRASSAHDGDRAMAMYRRACELADVAGCTGVAWVLLEGMIARPDYARALPILEDSCTAGHMPACTLIADQLTPANGVARAAGIAEDLARAIALYETACAAATTEGCSSGCNALGTLSYYGTHGSSNAKLAKDHVKAAAYHDKACRVGCINSCDTLGDMLRDGDGIPADPRRAAEVFEKACTAGPFAPSCMALSRLVAAGTGVAKDPAKAKRLAARACKLSRNQVGGCP